MKIMKITRKDLIAGKHSLATIQDENNNENVDMSKELGDFLFKLFLSTQNDKADNGDTLGFAISKEHMMKLEMNLNFIVRKRNIKETMQEINALYKEKVSLIQGYCKVREVSLFILDEYEEYKNLKQNFDSKYSINLTNLEMIAWIEL